MRCTVLSVGMALTLLLTTPASGALRTSAGAIAMAGDQSQDNSAFVPPVSAHAQYAATGQTTSAAALANSLVLPGLVSVEISAIATDTATSGAAVNVESQATLNGNAQIMLLQPLPPGVPPRVFLSLFASGGGGLTGDLDPDKEHGTVRGDVNFSLVTQMPFGGTSVLPIADPGFIADFSNPQGFFQQRVNFDFTLGAGDTFVQTVLTAEATGGVGVVDDTGNIGGHAIVDPRFDFDQAGFDAFAAAQGFPDINLADYYGFVFSDGIVPEPGAGVGLLAMVPLVSAFRRPPRHPAKPPTHA